MAVPILTLPASAAALAQLALSDGMGESGSGRALSVGAFAALFRSLTEGHGEAGADASPMAPPLFAAGDLAAEVGDAEDVGGNLDALLPFLEAMGIVQPSSPDRAETPENPAAAVPVSVTVAVPPASVPATSAGKPAAPTAAQAPADQKPLLSATVSTASGNARSVVSGSLASDAGTAGHAAAGVALTAPPADKAAARAAARSGDAQETKGLSRGREFSAQLVAAIAAGKEGERSPGSVAAVVQQVIADASPRHASPRHAEIAAWRGEPATDGIPPAEMPHVNANISPRHAEIAARRGEPATDGIAAGIPLPQAIADASLRHAHAAVAREEAVRLAQPVGATGWSEEIGNRLVWMANRMEGKAELVLTPPQMGRVEVTLSVSGDQATASFTSANPTVREALEAALPRLREVLAEAGIQLGQAQVGAENMRQPAQQDKNADNFGLGRTVRSDNAAGDTRSALLPAGSGLKGGRGLVDIFA